MVFYSYILLYYLRRLKQDILLCVMFVARVCSNRVSYKMVATFKYQLCLSYVYFANKLDPDQPRPNVECKFTACKDMTVRKRAKIRNRHNEVPHLTQDTNGKVTNSQ